MALALRAGALSADDGTVAKSQHTYFLRPGAWGPTLDLEVHRVNDSRSFALRRIDIMQGGRRVAESTAQYHRPDAGDDAQYTEMPDVPDPESLDPGAPLLPVPGLMEVRHVAPFEDRLTETVHPYWARFPGLSDEDLITRACAVAFVSDYLVICTPLVKGSNRGSAGQSRTLSHSLWFHRPPTNEWLLVSSVALTVGDGRFTSSGTVHDRSGVLVASFMQEGILRTS